MADGIEKLRREIDALDDELLALVNRRATLAQKIGALKGGAPVYRPERESQILGRIGKTNSGPLSADGRIAIFREIISACRAVEEPLRVAYLGPAGTFSEMAVLEQFGRSAETIACASIDEAFRAAETGGAQFAVVPVENSSEGAVGRSLDLLLTTRLKICAEIVLRVRQNVMRKGKGAKGKFDGVKRVYSHQQSLGQCQKWLAQHLPGAERIAVASNAEAARLASKEKAACAIGPRLAAERYGLDVIAADIEDESNNRTRFVVLGGIEPAPSGRDATSLVMSAPNRPGAVHALLEPLARHGVSMSRLESRPTRVGKWEYYFYVDLVGHRSDAPLAAALAELEKLAPFLKILGSYPAAP
ncbi:MAG TPA: prephenate dehydratase [Burkholderiales bacterium]|nr:prephenate dehydratase [Burkholderiales bacterium]